MSRRALALVPSPLRLVPQGRLHGVIYLFPELENYVSVFVKTLLNIGVFWHDWLTDKGDIPELLKIYYPSCRERRLDDIFYDFFECCMCLRTTTSEFWRSWNGACALCNTHFTSRRGLLERDIFSYIYSILLV